MLQYELTPNHGGMTLWGDYHALASIENLANEIEGGVLEAQESVDYLWQFSSALNEALKGQRCRGRVQFGEGDHYQMYGATFPWPTIIMHAATMRKALGSIGSTKYFQSTMFALEAIIEDAAMDAFPSTMRMVFRNAKLAVALNRDVSMGSIIRSRSFYFLKLPAKKRLIELDAVMETMDPMYIEHFRGYRRMQGAINPDVFDDPEEWPDFKL